MDKKRNRRNEKHDDHQNKSSQQHSNLKKSTLSKQKRSDLNALIKSLLEITTKKVKNPSEEWQRFVEIQTILSSVKTIEEPISPWPKGTSSNGVPSLNITKNDRLTNVDKFYEWFRKNGGKCTGVAITRFPEYELGLAATRDIKKGEELFSVPRKLVLSEENLNSSGIAKSPFATMSNISLAYTLIIEKLKGDNSFWNPYIDLLPQQEYTSVLYFTQDDMEKLRGSNIFPKALQLCVVIARQYAHFYELMQNTNSSSGSTIVSKLLKDYFCYDLYRWAVSTVMTRENLIPQSQSDAEKSPNDVKMLSALIPFWDMCNHKFGKLTTFYDAVTDKIDNTAQSDFAEGEQIFIHYGDRPNAHFMIYNGFIDSKHPKDYVEIKLGLSPSDSLYQKRAELLETLDLSKHTVLLKVLPAPVYISSELLAFVRVFNMNEDQLNHWLSAGNRARDLLHIDCALETCLESKTWQYLQTRLMLLLRAFPTTIEADEAEIKDYRDGKINLSCISAMILEYRMLEKRILAASLEYAKARTKV